MKNSAIIYSILIITGFLFIWFACSNTQNTDGETETEIHHAEGEQTPLIYHMGFISRFTKKLYFAGEAGNWELADIYSHEIEEISEDIAARNEEHHGINISRLMESMLLPQIERLEEAIDRKDHEMFLDRYNVMIQACNQCHTATDYGAVKVTVPEINPFNQDFSPSE